MNFQDETTRLYEPEWLLADPKEHRAAQMAAALTKRFPTLRPQPMQMKVQDALSYSSVDDYVVLALDTLEDTLQTLEARLPSQRVSYQFAGRGPGGVAGTRLAIQGTICPGDHETESASQLFLQTLAGMSQAASSRRLTGPDPLSAAVLAAASPGGESPDSPAFGRKRTGAAGFVRLTPERHVWSDHLSPHPGARGTTGHARTVDSSRP